MLDRFHLEIELFHNIFIRRKFENINLLFPIEHNKNACLKLLKKNCISIETGRACKVSKD